MTTVGEREIRTQQRVIEFFQGALGYRYLGNWRQREGNSNVEAELLSAWLTRQGHGPAIAGRALRELDKAASLGGGRDLYDANRHVYSLLRYGVKIAPAVGKPHKTVWLLDWKDPANNDFAVAEEVTFAGENKKRPDIVLYVNGIALGVLELKRSTVSVTEGIRQNLDSQKKEFIQPFFATVQFIMAGNETEGLRYGMIGTPEKYYLAWKEESPVPNPLHRALGQLCGKERLLELMHDFIVFDRGIKKTCRHNQYFGVRAAQERVGRREGGIIWHTQGSGKSLVMVWLAKWIRENVSDSRVLIVTDRMELDEQIEKVFKGVDEDIYRTKSGADLVAVLSREAEWLVCSLVHKFGVGEELTEAEVAKYIEDIKRSMPEGFRPRGEFFVFVDECHRTQSGKLHEAMKAILPSAMFIGFTGTPLLKKDKQKSIEVFGPYIHTYKYDEAVKDGVVLDLRYEARDIDQYITAQDRIDQWFEAKTRDLSDVAKAQLKQRWGTIQKVLSSRDRLEKIVADIIFDMETRDRLQSGLGNAMLVSDSIHSACRFFEMFQQTGLKGKCAVVTSYKPSAGAIKGEESGEGMTEKLCQYDVYRKMLSAYFDEPEEAAIHKADQFETEVKKRFVEEPGRMKLLIVVDKLLTGFDAPPATFLYIDKHMRDHGLFQAICRVNRLDTEDKEYGHVIDYKDLFRSLEGAIKDYTGEAFGGYDKADVEGLLKDRLEKGRERLEEMRESVKALCEPVPPPCDTPAYLRFFCAEDTTDREALKVNEPKRVKLYKLVAALVRAYANLANEMQEAGYTEAEAERIKAEVTHYEKVREEVKLASGDYVDMKMFEPAMRHLLDTYIRARDSERLSTFDDMTLVELIVERGADALETLPEGLRKNREAVAETIENNVRRLIIDEMALNPKYYERMSDLLEDLIRARREAAMDYRTYLSRIVELSKRVGTPEPQDAYPASVNTAARRALYDNLDQNEELSVELDTTIRRTKKDGWRGHKIKERELRHAISESLAPYGKQSEVEDIMEIVKSQRDY